MGLWFGRYALRTSWLSRSSEDMLVAMGKESLRLAAHVLARTSYESQPTEDHAEPRVKPAHPFNSVICAVAGDSTDEPARHQAAWLASPGGRVERVPASHLTRHGGRALNDSCEGHDLLALGGGAAAFAAVEQAPIPIVIARRCPLGTEVTDTIVVPVDGSPESSQALELAGLLAAAHGGTVTLIAAPARDLGLQRAIAASFGVLLRATGTAPHVMGEPRPPDRVIPSAAATLKASLVVLDSGRNPAERRMAALMVAAIGCSVLAVPRS